MDSFDSASLTRSLPSKSKGLRRLSSKSSEVTSRRQFNGIVLTLFEDVAGFETATCDRMARYLKALWTMYRRPARRIARSKGRLDHPILSGSSVSGILPHRMDSRSARYSTHSTAASQYSASAEGATWKNTGRVTTSGTTTRRTDGTDEPTHSLPTHSSHGETHFARAAKAAALRRFRRFFGSEQRHGRSSIPATSISSDIRSRRRC